MGIRFLQPQSCRSVDLRCFSIPVGMEKISVAGVDIIRIAACAIGDDLLQNRDNSSGSGVLRLFYTEQTQKLAVACRYCRYIGFSGFCFEPGSAFCIRWRSYKPPENLAGRDKTYCRQSARRRSWLFRHDSLGISAAGTYPMPDTGKQPPDSYL